MPVHDFTKISVRLDPNGLGFELFHEVFGLTCNVHSFRGYYDLWPFCKPYDLEEWWNFLDKEEAETAAAALTIYLQSVPERIVPPRISFIENETGFHLRNNGEVAGFALFRGEDDNNLWPFNRLPDWPNHKNRLDAMKACLRLQAYLDGRSAKKAKTAKKRK